MIALLLFAASLAPVDEAAYQKLVRGSGITVVNFWATWCAPCREEMPGLIALERRLAPSGVRLLLISADEPEDAGKAAEFLHKTGAPQPWRIKQATNDDRFIDAINPKWSGALPATFVYKGGRLAKSFIGEVEMKVLEAEIRRLQTTAARRPAPPKR